MTAARQCGLQANKNIVEQRLAAAVHRALFGRDVLLGPLCRCQGDSEEVVAARRRSAIFLPDDVVVGRQILGLVAAKVRVAMVPAGIADGIQLRNAQHACQAFQRFEQQAARAQPLEVLGQVTVDGQRGFTVDALVNALDGTDEHRQPP